jgi:hypothetical protein
LVNLWEEEEEEEERLQQQVSSGERKGILGSQLFSLLGLRAKSLKAIETMSCN